METNKETIKSHGSHRQLPRRTVAPPTFDLPPLAAVTGRVVRRLRGSKLETYIKLCLCFLFISFWAPGWIASLPTIYGISAIYNFRRHSFSSDMSVAPLTGNLSCRLFSGGIFDPYTDLWYK